MERVLLLHCAPNLPDTASTPTPLGFNRSPLAVSLCVKATIPTDSSWALCQGMKDMIDNNGDKTPGLAPNDSGGENEQKSLERFRRLSKVKTSRPREFQPYQFGTSHFKGQIIKIKNTFLWKANRSDKLQATP
ncbi:hypothetical protein PAMP_011846 [Pampus punctatissimus]